MSREFESERTVAREEAATIIRAVADGVTVGTLRIRGEEETADVDVPDEMDLEVESEVEEGKRSVEVELEWPDDEADVRPVAADDREATSADREESPIGPAAAESLGRFEVFRDRVDEWRWRLVHRNGNVIATSGEGYTRKHNALKGARSVQRNAPGADVVETD